MKPQLIKVLDKYGGLPISLFLYLLDPFFKKRKSKNVLVIKVWTIGDTILSFPFLKAVRENFSGKIFALATKRNIDVLSRVPYLDKIFLLEIGGITKVILKNINLISALRKENIGIVFDLEQWSFSSAIISYLTGANIRVGFNISRFGKDILYTHKINYIRPRYETLCFLDLLNAFGISRKDFKLEFPLADDEIKFAEDFLSSKGVFRDDFLVAIHPGASYPQKRWPISNFLEIIKYLKKSYNPKIILLGGKEEKKLVEEIIKNDDKDIIPCIGLQLGKLGALLKKCQLLITNDNGILHLASAVGTKTIAIFGMTDPKKWGPIGKYHVNLYQKLNCNPCVYLDFKPKCKERKCIISIHPGEVKKSILKLMQRNT